MKIGYKISFLDYWHIGSGLSGGALYDALVLKDKNKMPYIPGKTLKGLVRDNFEKIAGESKARDIFGYKNGRISKLVFSNANMSEKEYQSIISNGLQDFLYESLSFTKINEKGVAQTDTLREVEVVVPLCFEGNIEITEDIGEDKGLLIQALKMVKRMGLNRNRGLGRCYIEIKEEL